jgi:hypothetical protein
MSASQALHPPALTWRSLSDLPNSFFNSFLNGAHGILPFPSDTRLFLFLAARQCCVVKFMQPEEHAAMHSVQKIQAPRSIDNALSFEIAFAGHASMQELQFCGQSALFISGNPLKRSGSSGIVLGYRFVLWP